MADDVNQTTFGPYYPPYVQPYYVDVIDVILLSVITVAGTVGNLLIFATILTEKRLQNQSNALVMNIAFADLLIMAFIFPTVIGNVVSGGSILEQDACVFASCTVIVTCAVSIASMASISANRYVFICRNHEYERYFSKRNTAVMIAAMWTFWIVFMCVTGIWFPHEYNPDSLICIFNHQSSLFLTTFLMGFGIGIPAVITFICYYLIWRKITETQNAMRHHAKMTGTAGSEAEKRAQLRKRKENRATAALFVAFMCFLLFWGPYGIAAVVYYFQRLPQYTIKYLSWIGMSNSCVNSIVYGAMNKTYRDGYVRILTCGKRRVEPDKVNGHNSPHKGQQIQVKAVNVGRSVA